MRGHGRKSENKGRECRDREMRGYRDGTGVEGDKIAGPRGVEHNRHLTLKTFNTRTTKISYHLELPKPSI